MITKSILLVTASMAAAGAGYAAMTVVAPESAARIEGFVRNQGLGWNDGACASNPVGCLNNRYDKLTGLDREVEQSIRAIRAELRRVIELVAEQDMLSTKNGAFLDQGRSVYRERLGAADQPITFAGRAYPNLSVFRAQLELLFQEKSALETSLTSARELRAKLHERLDALMIQQGQISLASRMIPAQLQLVKANKALAEFNTNVAMIDGVIRGSETGLTQSEQMIRTTKDLLTPAAPAKPGTSKATTEAFEIFLRN